MCEAAEILRAAERQQSELFLRRSFVTSHVTSVERLSFVHAMAAAALRCQARSSKYMNGQPLLE
jgi:hypothetical protein